MASLCRSKQELTTELQGDTPFGSSWSVGQASQVVLLLPNKQERKAALRALLSENRKLQQELEASVGALKAGRPLTRGNIHRGRMEQV